MALDPKAVALAKAIRDVESGGDYNIKGQSGEGGAYQFMPETWKAWAGKYLGDPNAKMDRINQNKVAYYRIKERKDAGLTAAQIASEWNSGKADAYKQNWKGVNAQGVAYDTPAYVGKVKQAYAKYKPQETTVAPTVTAVAPTPKGTVEKITDFLGATKFGKALGATAAVLTGTSDEINANALRGAEADRQKAELLKRTDLSPVQRERIMRQLGQATSQPVQTAAEAMPELSYTPKEIYGSALNTALAATAGGALKAGRTAQAALQSKNLVQPATTVGGALVRNIGREAAVGSVYGGVGGVGRAMSENKDIGEIAKEGLYGAGAGAVIGGGLAGTIGGVGAIAAKSKASSRLINSLIKPLGKEFDFGRNPGQGVVDEGIVANNRDGLFKGIIAKKKEIGEKIGAMLRTPTAQQKRVDVGSAVKAVDTALQKAVASGEQALITRIQQVRKTLTDEFGLIDGQVITTGKKNLLITPEQAHKVKQALGEASKWTGQAFDAEANQARVAAYRALNDAIEQAVPGVKKFQDRYANMLSAERSLERTMDITQRQNMLSFMDKGIGAGVGGGALVAGVGGIPAILASVGAVLANKAMKSTAFKTRLAQFLERLNPLEKKALDTLSTNEKQEIVKYLADIIKEPPKLALPVGKSAVKEYGQINLPSEGILGAQNVLAGRASAPTVNPVKVKLLDILKQVKNEPLALPEKASMSARPIELPAPGVLDAQNVLAGRTSAPVAKPVAPIAETPRTAQTNALKKKIKSSDPLTTEARKYASAEEFVKAQFNKPSYGMSHRPTYEDMPPAHNLLEGGQIPKDVYEHPEFSIASGRNLNTDKSAKESWSALQKIRNKPDAEVTIYRASPKNELNNGDWVTFSKNYAKDSIEGTAEKVHSFKVKAKDVIFAGDDINEFGYYPKSQLTDIWNKAHGK